MFEFQKISTNNLKLQIINAHTLLGFSKTEILIDYNSITFNEDLSFPYSVPDGYDRIFIN
jgi:hypothetical protein